MGHAIAEAIKQAPSTIRIGYANILMHRLDPPPSKQTWRTRKKEPVCLLSQYLSAVHNPYGIIQGCVHTYMCLSPTEDPY